MFHLLTHTHLVLITWLVEVSAYARCFAPSAIYHLDTSQRSSSFLGGEINRAIVPPPRTPFPAGVGTK